MKSTSMVILNYGQQEISRRVNIYHEFGKHCTKGLVIIMSYKFLPHIIYCMSYTFVPHVVQCYTTDAGIQNFLKDLEDTLVEHFCYIKRMDRTWTPRTALELTSKYG
jgi:hypothetical protein